MSVFLRALARDLNASTPGKGVGVIGQCFTGGFALAAAVDNSVPAPVLSQPSLPLPLTPAQRRDAGVSEPDLNAVADRAANEGLCAMGLRFSEDKVSPRERFQTLSGCGLPRATSSPATTVPKVPAGAAPVAIRRATVQ